MAFPQSWLCKGCGRPYIVDDRPLSSLPTHLTRTNNAPSAQELIDSEEEFSTANLTHELDALNEEVDRLQRTLNALEARRVKVETHLRMCRSITSSLRRVPPEIISRILGHLVGATAGIEREKITLDTRRGIWTYSRVSQLWRSVTLSTPSFWSTFILDFGPSPRTKGTLKCIETILSRSREHPLSFELTYDSHHWPDTWNVSPLEMLIAHAPRWRGAFFSLHPVLFGCLNGVKGCTPILESLGFQRRIGHPVPSLDYFRDAPALRKVSFRDFDCLPSFFVLPWSQITECILDSFVDNCMQVLALMPNLVSLDASNLWCSDNEVIELNKLCKLKAFGGSFIAYLTLPALREIDVLLLSNTLTNVIALIERSGCSITTLAFRHYYYSNIQLNIDNMLLIAFLKSLHTVSVLDLSRKSIDNVSRFCQVLVTFTAEHHSYLLPALSELILPPLLDHPEACSTVVSLLSQRRQHDLESTDATHTTIERVIFIGADQSLPPEMKSLEEEGLQDLFRWLPGAE